MSAPPLPSAGSFFDVVDFLLGPGAARISVVVPDRGRNTAPGGPRTNSPSVADRLGNAVRSGGRTNAPYNAASPGNTPRGRRTNAPSAAARTGNVPSLEVGEAPAQGGDSIDDER